MHILARNLPSSLILNKQDERIHYEEEEPTCKYMVKTAEEPILRKWRNHFSYLPDPLINIIYRFRPTRNILTMQLQVKDCILELQNIYNNVSFLLNTQMIIHIGLFKQGLNA